MKTRLTELLGIDTPIVCGGMMRVGTADLAAAASNAGANQEKAWSTGDIEAGMVTVGMCGGLINDIPSCEELVSNIVSNAEQIISERLASIIAA